MRADLSRRRIVLRPLPLVALCLIASLVIVPLLAAPRSAAAARQTYVVTAAEMTARAAKHFPMRRCTLLIACVTLSDPQVALAAGDERIHLRVQALPELGGRAFDRGEVKVAGKLRYEPDRGAFYIDEGTVTGARFPGVSADQARLVSDLASGPLSAWLRDNAIHVLDESDGNQALARLVLRSVRIEDGKLLLGVGDDDD